MHSGRFSFPPRYFYEVLRGLDYMRARTSNRTSDVPRGSTWSRRSEPWNNPPRHAGLGLVRARPCPMTRRTSLTIEQVLALLTETPRRIAALTKGLTAAELHASPNETVSSVNDVLAHLRSCADGRANSSGDPCRGQVRLS